MSRLIDADAFKEYMRKALEETRGCYPDKGEWAEAITEQFCKDIDDQPTIEERKTGKWIEDAETYYRAVNEKGGGVNENTPYFTDDIACSECLAKFSVIDNEAERFDFCPNCGSYNGGAE